MVIIRTCLLFAALGFICICEPAAGQLRSVTFEGGSDWFAKDWNIGNYSGQCQTVSEGMTIVDDPAPPALPNQVGCISLKSCGVTTLDGQQWPISDNRGEGFVLTYGDRNEIDLGYTYIYDFSIYIPQDFSDFTHTLGGSWTIISQWPCWDSDPAKSCPKTDPDLYCDVGAAGSALVLRDYLYSMEFRVRNVEEQEDDCITLAQVPAIEGGWDRHIMQIKWASDNTGFIRWWINGQQVAEAFDFRTWWDSPIAKPAWKLGMYMGSWQDGPWDAPDNDVTLYFDDLYLYENVDIETVCPDCEGISLAAPTNLSAVADTADQVTLSWSDNSYNEDGFIIHRRPYLGSVDWQQVAEVGPDTSMYVDTATLYGGVVYTYRVGSYRNSP